MTIGYTTGVYDLFHMGHLNLLKNAKGMCDKLIVGVTVDELVAYKGKQAMIPFDERVEIVRACRYVDSAIPQYDMDKLAMWHGPIRPRQVAGYRQPVRQNLHRPLPRRY